MSPVNIILVDDHPLVRRGLRAVLAAEDDFQVVAEIGDGLEALRIVSELKPDVLVVDIMLPGLNGLEVARRVGQTFPQTQVIILSMHSNDAYVAEAWRAGAAGYVLKDSNVGDLVQAVRTVTAGKRFLSAPLSERMIETYLQGARDQALDLYETLTTREREVLQLAAEGLRAEDIASRLSIKPRTAELHRANMMRKLDLHSQTDLVKYAAKRGLIQLST